MSCVTVGGATPCARSAPRTLAKAAAWNGPVMLSPSTGCHCQSGDGPAGAKNSYPGSPASEAMSGTVRIGSGVRPTACACQGGAENRELTPPPVAPHVSCQVTPSVLTGSPDVTMIPPVAITQGELAG